MAKASTKHLLPLHAYHLSRRLHGYLTMIDGYPSVMDKALRIVEKVGRLKEVGVAKMWLFNKLGSLKVLGLVN